MLEVVGVTGVVHLGQIQSGLRSAMRIAQGGHIKIRLNTELPVQVDGEPWIQTPGDVVVLKSALKVSINHLVHLNLCLCICLSVVSVCLNLFMIISYLLTSTELSDLNYYCILE